MPKVRAEANKEAALLDSFEMEQAGNRIRIYDRDGSVYEGNVEAEAGASALKSPTSNVLEKNKAQAQTKEALVDRKVEALSDAELGQQKQSFRASGTNRSLNQLVVINGQLISAVATVSNQQSQYFFRRSATPAAGPSQATATGQAGGGLLGERAASLSSVSAGQSGQLGGSTSAVLRIQGRAQIGPANEVPIDALRVPR
jgi:hypothetical protein